MIFCRCQKFTPEKHESSVKTRYSLLQAKLDFSQKISKSQTTHQICLDYNNCIIIYIQPAQNERSDVEDSLL